MAGGVGGGLPEPRAEAQHTQLVAESALASGMQAIAERLCDLVMRLDGELRICQQTVSADVFFGRPVFGESIGALLLSSDMERVAKGCASASSLAVPQLVPATLVMSTGASTEAHLVITDTGATTQRFIVGVSVRSVEQAPGGGPDGGIEADR